jgi:hypothetical protein
MELVDLMPTQESFLMLNMASLQCTMCLVLVVDGFLDCWDETVTDRGTTCCFVDIVKSLRAPAFLLEQASGSMERSLALLLGAIEYGSSY